MKEKILKHKNLALFLILVLALTGTYLFEEKSNHDLKTLNAKASSLLDADKLGDIQAIEGIKLNFQKKGELYFDKITGLQLAEARLGEFFQILSGLKVKTFLDQAEVNKVGKNFYIPDPTMKMTFQFEKGAMTFTLGKKLDYDQTFYMEVTKNGISQIVIVSDESPDPGVYQSDEEYKKSDAKYKRLEVVFLLTNRYFYDTKVFRDFKYTDERINFKHISIATFRNKKYSIDFQKSQTIPAPPKGIAYYEDNWVSFLEMLTKLEGKSIYFPAETKLLTEILSVFEVIDRQERKYTLTVYKKYGELSGYFLKTTLDNIVYELKSEDAQYFFVNVQDFWQKRIIPKEKEFNFKVTFLDNKTETVRISDKELFKVFPTDSKFTEGTIRALEFKRLLEFFKSEGNHVTEFTEKPSEILKKNIMRVQFDNRNLSVILEDNEAIVVDFDLSIMIHYYIGAKLPFSIKHEDYFIAAKK